jgi:hypothetical protein
MLRLPKRAWGGRAAGFKIHLGSDEQWLKQMADFAYFVWLLNIYVTPADLDPIRTNTFEQGPRLSKGYFDRAWSTSSIIGY